MISKVTFSSHLTSWLCKRCSLHLQCLSCSHLLYQPYHLLLIFTSYLKYHLVWVTSSDSSSDTSVSSLYSNCNWNIRLTDVRERFYVSRELSWFPLLLFKNSFSLVYFSSINCKEMFCSSWSLRPNTVKLRKNKVEQFIPKVRTIDSSGQGMTCFRFCWCTYCLNPSSSSFDWWVMLLQIEDSHNQFQLLTLRLHCHLPWEPF